MIIFGIDPGTAVTGYGVIKVQNNSVSCVDAGVIATDATRPLAERLEIIYDKLCEKIQLHKPSRVCVEQAFYGKNVHTTLVLGHARGVAMLVARKYGAEIMEYSPREIKKAVTGNGNATKEQVAFMVKMLLPSSGNHERSDTYDALAVALCDFNRAGTAIPGVIK
ncbi:MAG TPA: crossover junction endodeoxyribonuclease RuvC [Chitinispirillaceae bacterium]|jgi:crossover junction endodeoxyribonuclease RuvC|nr:crossover junction endodeoxyribonuclease RuvC [Chitinispirillaceae bacterium]